MSLLNQAAQNIENILSTITDLINIASFNKSFRATVTQNVNNAKYKVSYKNREYSVKSDYILDVGDIVWVCAPGNDWDSLFVQRCDRVENKIRSLQKYEFQDDGIYLDGVKITK